MSEIDFVTHMSNAFTDKYGVQLYQYFVNEAIYGKYFSASELRRSFFPENENVWLEPSNFCRDYKKIVRTGNTIVFGHWHCSLGHLISSDGELSEFGENACWDIYKNEDWKIIQTGV